MKAILIALALVFGLAAAAVITTSVAYACEVSDPGCQPLSTFAKEKS
jgi:hypothetical protein